MVRTQGPNAGGTSMIHAGAAGALVGRRPARGFTLLELCVVVFIMGLLAAVSFPRLMPVIAFSNLEGAARHLANYGRSVIDYATLQREAVTVRLDLDQQEYYAVHWIDPETEEGEVEGEVEDQLAKLADLRAGGVSADDLSGMLRGESLEGGSLGQMPDGFDQELADAQMNDRFARFARRALEERAKNVKHEEGLVEEIGPLFDQEFELEDSEPIEEELFDPILKRVRLKLEDEKNPEVWIESVVIDGTSSSRGVAEIVLTSLGLTQKPVFYVANSDCDYYTVVWDPLTGGADVFDGHQDIE